MQSAAPRRMTPTASANANKADDSRQVIVLLGPRASNSIETWHAGMLGSCRKSHNGQISPIASWPQRSKSKPLSTSVQAAAASASSSGVVEIRPAPNETPRRSGSTSPRVKRASFIEREAATTPS